MSSQPDTKWKRPRNIRGLGDVVALVAQPVAKVIDRVAGTSIQSCQGCAARRQALNNAVPFHQADTQPPQVGNGEESEN